MEPWILVFVSNFLLACWIRNLCINIAKLEMSIRPKEPVIEVPLLEQKPQKPANRKPRTDEQKAFASKKMKERLEKKRQEEMNAHPDVYDTKQ